MNLIETNETAEYQEESLLDAALAGMAMIGCVVGTYFLLLFVSVQS